MIRMATLPDMWERTITIGSAGKTFSVTGWKLGWAVGPQHLIRNCQVAHQVSAFAPFPLHDRQALFYEKKYLELRLHVPHSDPRGRRKVLKQAALVALSPKNAHSHIVFRGFELELTRLGSPESYFKSISVDLRRKRDYIAKVLQDVGLNPVIPEGGYFIMADWSSFGKTNLEFSGNSADPFF